MNLIISRRLRDLNFKDYSDSFLLDIFYKCIIKKGKAGKANANFSKLCFLIKKHFPQEEAAHVIARSLLRIKPVIGLRLKKVAGINYQLPFPITEKKASKLAVHWFFQVLDNRIEKKFVDRMLFEILDIRRGKGLSNARKSSLEKIALDNRPFVFFLKR